MGGATRLIVLLATPFSLLQPRLSRLRVARSSHFFPVSSPSCYRLSFSTAGSPKFHSQPVAIHDDHFSDNSLGALPSSHAPAPQPWPEWSKLVNSLAARGYFDGQRIVVEGDEFAFGNLPDEFVRTATAALNFSRDCPNLLRSLTRRDVAVVVENGTSFLFRGGDHSERKMRSFLGRGENVSEFDKAHTVDLMRFLLSYVGNRIASLEAGKVPNTELVETSLRNLLHELVSLNYYGSPESDISGPMQDQFLDRCGQGQRVSGQNIQMKRGDWICPRCNFMNFARNLKCLECEEMSPKSRLMEGGWECPQCDFSNYSRNTECLRCDCKRPEDASFNKSSSQLGLGESHMHKIDIDNHSTANEEKAARWFSKVSRARSNPDSNEEFFETMQSRKATDQVSTRRMSNSQYQRHSDCYGNFKEDNFENGVANKALDSKISNSLDKILRRTSTTSRTGYRNGNAGQDAQSETHPSLSASTSTRYVPSVSEGGEHVKSPVRWFQRIAEMHPESGVPSEGESSPSVGRNDHSLTSPMHKTHMNMEKPSNPTTGDPTNYFMGSGTYGNERRRGGETCGAPTSGNGTHNFTGSSQLDAKGNWTGKSLEGSAVKEPPDPLDMSEEAKAERWFRRVAQIKDISELSQIPDEDFPSIMPMRKGVNRFVVSKRKTPLERRLTSPQYRKNLPVVSSDPVKKGDDGS